MENRTLTNILGFTTLAYVVFFYLFLASWYQNIPWIDDFWMLGSLQKFIESDLLTIKYESLISQANEHRIVFTRLLSLFSYYVFGHVDFRFLMWVGNLSLLGSVFLLYKASAIKRTEAYLFLPVVFLVLQIQNWENLLWGLTSSQNLGVIFWTFLSLWFCKSNRLTFAIGAAFMASITSSNGLFVWFLGAFLLVSEGKKKQLIAWSFFSVATIVWYFSNYQVVNNSSIVWAKLYNHFFYFLTILGGSAPVLVVLTMPLGIVVFVILTRYLYKYDFKENKLLFAYLTFLVITVLVLAVKRCSICESAFYVTTPLSKYRIYSALILSISYLVLLDWARYKGFYLRFFYFAFPVSVIFCGISYREYIPYFKRLKNEKMTIVSNIGNQDYAVPLVPASSQMEVKQYYSRALDAGLYKIPELGK